MRHYFLLLIAFVPLLTEAQSTLVIRNIAVVDVKAGTVSRNKTVIIQGNRITSIRDKAKRLRNAITIDGKGKYLIPGLWDMHAHALLDSTYVWVFPLLVANGVTGIRDMGNNLPFQQIDQIRRDILEGKILGPRLGATTAKIMDGIKVGQSAVSGASLSSNATAVKTPEEARELVKEYKRQGMDFIKPYNHLSREEYLAIVDEAKKQNIPFAGHVPNAMTAAKVSDLGQSSIEHNWDIFVSCSHDEAILRQELEKIPYNQPVSPARAEINRKAVATYDHAKAAKLFGHFAQNGTWMCPTIVFFTPIVFQENELMNDKRLQYIPKYLQTIWHNQFRQRAALNSNDEKKLNDQRRLEIIGLMDSVGVGLLAGTDLNNAYVFPGFSVHEELENFVNAGLSPSAALRTATINPAIFLKATDKLGTIGKGKIADLLLLDADPLENISNTKKIYAVILNGRLLERKDLDELLNKAKELAAK
jgi:imidazolonepropionase-like amidohydrolase